MPIIVESLREVRAELRRPDSVWWTSMPERFYIGRIQTFYQLDGSKWRNPYYASSRLANVRRYAEMLADRPKLLAALDELADRRLVCWCAPLLCHGHVLKAAVEHPDSRVDPALLFDLARQFAKPVVW